MAIEANNTWIVAFSFNKGAAGTILSHGKKTVDHYRDLTTLLFIRPDCLGDFLEGDIPKLVNMHQQDATYWFTGMTGYGWHDWLWLA